MVFLDDVAKEVADFLEACDLIEPPINIFHILRELNIFFHYIKPIRRLSGTHVGGQPKRNIRPIILLSRGQSYDRRRFTAAHEFKHALFDVDEDFELTYNRRLSRLEREANQFASHLLVPESMLKKIVDGYNNANVTMISRIFGVSFTAAYYRLLNSGFIEDAVVPLTQFRRDDETAFKEMQFLCIPTHISEWKMVKVVMNGSDMMHRNCMRCKIPIVDGQLDCCWGCGKRTDIYTPGDFDIESFDYSISPVPSTFS